ncbi:MAG: phosphoglycerate dehydrogenase [Candidatus Dormibacteria bacterium]
MTTADTSGIVATDLFTTAPRVLVADPIAADGVERLRAAAEVDVVTGMDEASLIQRIHAYDALVVRSETRVTADVLAAATRLRVVGRAGVGVDNIDLDAATQHGVLVLNAPTGNTIAAAEHAIAMILALARNIPRADASLRAGRWERGALIGTELRDKTLGLLGLGKIGFEVARIAGEGLRMRVIAHDPITTAERAEQAGAELVEFETVLREADIISMHVPLTERTRGMIGAAELRRMKNTARIVNVARGGVIDEAALAEAVRDGVIAGAAVDVFTKEPLDPANPLIGVEGIVLTPHLGASTAEAQVNVAADVADQIVEYLRGGAPRYAVNAPAVNPEELARLRPYLELARKLGSLGAQLQGGGVRRLVCSYAGELAELDTTLVTAEVLRGLLAHFSDARVNVINAKTVAKSLGVDVDERTTTRSVDHANSMFVEIIGEGRLLLAGTQFEGAARITRIDDFRVDMQPSGTFLVVQHEDRPGVISAVSTLLAKNDINIARIELGRDRPRGQAVMLMEVDDPISDSLLDELGRTAKLERLRQVTL